MCGCGRNEVDVFLYIFLYIYIYIYIYILLHMHLLRMCHSESEQNVMCFSLFYHSIDGFLFFLLRCKCFIFHQNEVERMTSSRLNIWTNETLVWRMTSTFNHIYPSTCAIEIKGFAFVAKKPSLNTKNMQICSCLPCRMNIVHPSKLLWLIRRYY